jgi:hypothetical protein
VCRAIFDDTLRQARPHRRQQLELGRGRTVGIDAETIAQGRTLPCGLFACWSRRAARTRLNFCRMGFGLPVGHGHRTQRTKEHDQREVRIASELHRSSYRQRAPEVAKKTQERD